MAGNPWSKFFWQDWESDPALKLCSLAAQGLWMRMLCIAARHDPVGYVAVSGNALDETGLARLTGVAESEVQTLLIELSQHGVFSRDRHGRIYSRRLIRDARRSANARKFGKLGGNPTLGKHDEKSERDNPQHKPQLKGEDKPHKPEARTIPNGMGGEPPNLTEQLWSVGLAAVTASGTPEKQARGLLGKWRKAVGDGPVLTLLLQAQQQSVSDLVPWMEAAIRNGGKVVPFRRETEQERVDREFRERMQRKYGSEGKRDAGGSSAGGAVG